MAPRGVVSLVFDDGYEHIYQDVLPILNHANVPGTFAVTTGTKNISDLEHIPLRPWQKWQDVKQFGHELASHTISHRDLTTLPLDQVESELAQSSDLIKATTLVYPGGAANQEITKLASKYYQVARSVKHGFEKLPPEEPMQLKTYNFRRGNFSPLKANLLALYAFLTNSWLIETYHIISDYEQEATHTVKLRDFKKHVAFLQKLPIQKLTINQAINSL